MTDVESARLKASELADKAELSSYIRRNLIRAAITLIVLFGALAAVGKVFQPELIALTESIYQTIGVAGLLGVLFVSDAMFSPLPPDVVLIVIANSELSSEWPWLLPTIGALSAIAGNLGWWFGHRFARFEWATRWTQKLRKKYSDQILRYDRWAIVLGAITPLPFSLICITAGALGMRWRRLAPITLLRIPRFALVYIVVAYSAGY
jgi:membrane protein YqaA with SNARE-associated domain